MASQKKSRLFYFDYLRVFVITIVILLHALLPHVKDYSWYVNEAQKVELFGLLALVIDVFIMPIMFFAAGYFTYSSLKKRGITSFLYNKFKRIAVPFFIGVFFFVPIMTYMSALIEAGSDLSFIHYWTNLYFESGLGAGHYWFLASLFFFYLTFAVIYKIYGDKIDSIYQKQISGGLKPNKKFIFLFFIVGILLFFAVSLISNDGNWFAVWEIFSFQPTRWTIYLLYFYLGIFAYLKQIKVSDRFLKKIPLFVGGTVVLTLAYLAFKIAFITKIASSISLKMANAALHFSLCFAIFVTLLLIFRKYLNQSSKLLNRLAVHSYSIYYIHMVIVVVMQYFLLSYDFSPYLKFLIVFSGSAVLSYLLSEAYLQVSKGIKNVIQNFSATAAPVEKELD
ncbi:MAG: acyltransferase family protein [Bacillota bacterium]